MRFSARPLQKALLGGAHPATLTLPAQMCSCLLEQNGSLSKSGGDSQSPFTAIHCLQVYIAHLYASSLAYKLIPFTAIHCLQVYIAHLYASSLAYRLIPFTATHCSQVRSTQLQNILLACLVIVHDTVKCIGLGVASEASQSELQPPHCVALLYHVVFCTSI